MKRVTASVPLLLLAAIAVRSDDARAQSQQPVATFRSGTVLAQLDIRVVDDKTGRPIQDLRADEIEIIEAGRRRPVLLFQHMSDPAAPLMEAAERTITGEVSTNQGAPRGQLYILIFDQGHISSGNEQRARAAAARFLTTRVRPGDRVALYGIPGPGPQIGFTPNVERVIAELPKVRGGLDRFSNGAIGAMRIQEALEVTRGNNEVLVKVANRLSAARSGTDVLAGIGAGAPGGGADDRAVFEMLVKEDARAMVARADQRARNFLLMFADIVRQMRAIDGRKSVMLFSEGFFADNVSREIEQVAAAAAESYTVINTLDLNRRQLEIREPEPVGADHFNEIQSRLGAIGSLSAETDGILMADAVSALDRSLERVAENSRDYYLVGFEPESSDSGALYQRVTVGVTRPGARVFARTGYSADLGKRIPQRRHTIDAALKAPFPHQGLSVSYTSYVMRGASPGMQKVFVSLMTHLPVTDAAAPRADVVFVVRDVRDGRVMASGTDTLPMPRVAEPGATTGTAHYKVQFELPAGSYLMRAVVRDPSGLVGSADRRFDVRRLDRPGVTFSDLILSDVRGALPVRAIAHHGSGLVGTLELYAPSPAQLSDVSVTAELAPVGGQRAVSVVRAGLQEVRGGDGAASRAARLAVPLTGVPLGDYLVTAIVRAGGEQVGTATRELRVADESSVAPVAAPERAHPNPAAVLEGRMAQEYLRELHRAAVGTPLQQAAEYALTAAWAPVLAAVPQGEAAMSPAGSALRGLARLGLGEYAGAADDLRRAFDAGDRKDARAAFVLGWASAGAGRPRDAISAWRAAVFIDPLMVPAYLAMADQYMRLSEAALAAQALRTGLSAIPDSPELKSKLSEIERATSRPRS
ncbi:MAG: VWA domain-containing protein [Vicinamibacterales bacterium]